MTEDAIVHWFGPSWNAMINHDCPEDQTPVGALCINCRQPIEADDRGVTMMYGYDRPDEFLIPGTHRCATHIDCHIHSIFPPRSAYWAERHVPKRKQSMECMCRDCGSPASMHIGIGPNGCKGWL